MPKTGFSKPIDVICPVDDSVICEFSFDMDIGKTLDRHMTEKHPDWKKNQFLSYFPKVGSVQCSYCPMYYSRADYLARHISAKHLDR